MIVINLSWELVWFRKKYFKFKYSQNMWWKEKNCPCVSFLFIFYIYYSFYSFSFSIFQVSRNFLSYRFLLYGRNTCTCIVCYSKSTILDFLRKNDRRIRRIFHEGVSQASVSPVSGSLADRRSVCDEYTEYSSFRRWNPRYIATQLGSSDVGRSLGCAMIHGEFLVDARLSLSMRDFPEVRISRASTAYSRSRVTGYRCAWHNHHLNYTSGIARTREREREREWRRTRRTKGESLPSEG